jgi:hypothetical protein
LQGLSPLSWLSFSQPPDLPAVPGQVMPGLASRLAQCSPRKPRLNAHTAARPRSPNPLDGIVGRYRIRQHFRHDLPEIAPIRVQPNTRFASRRLQFDRTEVCPRRPYSRINSVQQDRTDWGVFSKSVPPGLPSVTCRKPNSPSDRTSGLLSVSNLIDNTRDRNRGLGRRASVEPDKPLSWRSGSTGQHVAVGDFGLNSFRQFQTTSVGKRRSSAVQKLHP